MPPYQEQFPVGSNVRVVSRQKLERFKSDWKFHHPLMGEQFEYAGKVFGVEKTSFYHGGDVLYTLSGASGIWHEQCLEMADSRTLCLI
jgi:hypothetical protein